MTTPSFQGIEVPLVTVDHLAAFHLAHFGEPAPLDSFPASTGAPTHADEENHGAGEAQYHANNAYEYDEYDNDDDDGLGYYPDGAKRTLTDEQIAMFRHSEIARILRAREIALENAEADAEADAEAQSSESEEGSQHSQPVAVASLAEKSKGEDGKIDEGGEEVEDTAAARTSQESRPRSRDLRFERSEISPAKRKLSSPGENEDSWPKKSRRAHVRYLDAVTSDEQVLNYDEGEPTSTTAATNPSVEVSGELGDKPEGKKIWWPTLGTS